MQRIGSIPKRRNSKPSSTSSVSLPTKLKSNKPPQHTITYKNTNNDPTKQDKAEAIKRSYKKQSSTFSFSRGRTNSNGSKGSGGGKSGRSNSRGPMKQLSNNLLSSKSKTKPSKVKKEATAKASGGVIKAKAIDPPAQTDENRDVYQKSYQNKTKSMDNKAEVGWVNVPKDTKVSFKTKPNSADQDQNEVSEDDEEEAVQINILHSQGGNKYTDKLLINPDQVNTSKEICFSDNTDNPFPDEVNFDETFTTVNTDEDANGIQVVASKSKGEVIQKKENQVMYTMDGGNESTKLMSKRKQRKVQAKQLKNANTRALKASLAKDTSSMSKGRVSRSNGKKKLTAEEKRKERVQQNLIKLQTIAGQEVKKKQELLQKESKLVMNVVTDSMDRRDSPFDRLCSSTPHEISMAVKEEFRKQKERPFDGICFQPSSQETFDDGYSQISMDDDFTYGTNAQQSINSNSLFELGSLMDNNNDDEENDDLVTNNRSAFDSSRLGCFESGILWILNGRGCTFGRDE